MNIYGWAANFKCYFWPQRKIAAKSYSETTFDDTLIPESSFETLRSEDLLAKRGDAFNAEKPTSLALFH